ncbi:aspartyl/asparaginyl beta-hydroxylase domain-containing protein [Corallococcus sp. CA049B]|uniref:aspartyl/asparaginyl beta-hydroxylase domain-containing protein n=1 Tax=Corallococcus sp. CA049B TaxID=2316730 RepID=UPI000EA3F743|nr:aspartyl/asparaginyl beta-hydroxylase domain-containing protein [Corallococcus sp. CA049B]RKG90852.1 aspartyl/asparaginyl beta-hydroxylase domain-containing protein [Corallococcus sp. CA049B]
MGSGPVAVRLNRTYDVERLRRDLAASERFQWVPETDGGVAEHQDWDVLPLVSRGGRLDDGSAGTNSLVPFRSTELLDHVPYFREVLEGFKASLRSVRISAIRPGGIIREHSDTDVFDVRGGDLIRLHIPIVTNDDVVFRIGGERCVWKPGELWYGDFSQLHSVENRGDTTRVHLLVGAEVNDEILSLFPPEFLAAHDIQVRRRTAASEALRSRLEFDGRLEAGPAQLAALLEGLPDSIQADLRKTFTGLLCFRFVDERLAVLIDGEPMFFLEPESDSRWRVMDMMAHVDFAPAASPSAVARLEFAKGEQPFSFVISRA